MEDEKRIEPPIKGKKEIFQYWDMEERTHEMLNRSIVVWGESGYGKSFFINTFLNYIAPYIYVMKAYSGTAENDKDFPLEKYTSPLFIKNTLDIESLKKDLKYGKDKVSMLEENKDLTKLHETMRNFILPLYESTGYKRLGRTKKAYKKIKKLEKKLDPEKNKNYDELTIIDRSEIKEKIFNYYKVLFYQCKKYIRKNNFEIPKEIKKYSAPIYFSDLKINTLLYFNDVSSAAKNIKGDDKTVYGDLHTLGRHGGFTVLWALHGCTFMAKEIRSQIKFHIFVTSSSLMNYISTNNITGSLKKRFEDANEAILISDKSRGTEKKFNLILYDKTKGDDIYYTRANNKLDQKLVGDESLLESLKPYECNIKTTDNRLAELFG